MRVHLILLAALFVAVLSPIAVTAEDLMSVDDVLSTQTLRELSLSTDGRWLVWVERHNEEKPNRSVDDLWRIDLSDSKAEARQLTRGDQNDRAPALSPDGKWIAFLSKRGDEKAKTQIWRIPPDGGEPEQISKWEAGVEDFRWAGDGRLIFRAREGKTLRDRDLEEKKDDSRVIEDIDHWPAVRLFALDPASGEVKRLTDNDDQIAGFWLRADGRAMVTRHRVSIYFRSQPGGPRDRYYLHDFDSGDVSEIFTDPMFDPSRIEFTADGKGLLAQWLYSRLSTPELAVSAGIETLWNHDLESGERSQIDLGTELGLSDHVRGGSWQVTEKGFVALLADRVHVKPAVFEGSGSSWRRRDLSGEGVENLYSLAVTRDAKTCAFVHTEADAPEKLMVAGLRGTKLRDARLVRDPNEKLRAKVGRSYVVSWMSSLDGVEISGILTYPKGYEEGRRYPLMVWIHGGPTGVDADAFENYWSSYPHLLASKGMFVLQPNYRGGTDHGLDYVEAITGGKYYEVEIPDILDGVEHCIDAGLAHPDSLGSMGWSNGAILTIQLTIETDRFKVACAGAGDVNWTSDFGNCAFGPNFDITYFGTTPWEDPDLYVNKSPLFKMAEVSTPTLIQFGEKDTSVPTSQGWEHYRAMQIIGKAPVRFLIYPGMGHGLSKVSYQKRKIEEELAWIDRHLFDREPKKDEVVKPGSPLDMSLARRNLLTPERGLGDLKQDRLLPVMADEPLGDTGVILAKTEVTWSQFYSFQREWKSSFTQDSPWSGSRGFSLELGQPWSELPVHGLQFLHAKAYTRWLSEITGEEYRLPTRSEMELALKQAAPEHENNLCHWAGYTPTPDEARQLRENMQASGDPSKYLLLPATLAAKSDAAYFDLDGNVSEWVLEDDMKTGALMGRNVLDSCEKSAALVDVPEELRGFRVVKVIKAE